MALPAKKIGELNGIWAMLLKFQLAVFTAVLPLVLIWCGWLTSQAFQAQAFRESGERFTEAEARLLEDRAREARSALSAVYSAKVEATNIRLVAIERDITKILTLLQKNEHL